MSSIRTKKYGLVLPTLFLVLLSTLFVMLPKTWAGKYYWTSNYGGTGDEAGWSIQNTADGGYVVTGYTTSVGEGDKSKFWVLKLSEDGKVQWQKTYYYAWDLADLTQQTSDGGYVVVGYTWSYSLNAWDVWILKLNGNGDIQWQKTYGGQKDDQAVSIQQTSDGGYVVAGETKSYGAGDWDVWVLKLDGNGNIQWQKTYGGAKSDSTSADPIQQTSDGGYIVSGRTESFGAGEFDVWVLKLNKDGAIQWQKTYGGTAYDRARAVRQTSDGGYVVAGYTRSFGAGNLDVWILKLDVNGIPKWQKTFGGSKDEKTYSIWDTADGGSVSAGYTKSFGAGNSDAWIIKLDGKGNIQWQRTYGKGNDDGAASIRQTTNGGYIVAGWTASFGPDDDDFWVLRLNGNGNIPGCSLIRTSSVAAVNTEVVGVASQATTSNSGAQVKVTNIAPKNSYARVGTTCKVEADPVPDIKANGSDNSITVSKGIPVAITISLDSGSQIAQNADWWVIENAPDGWYYYDVIGGSWSFLTGISVTYQGPLFNFASFGILNTSGLPVGTYIFYFGVDMNMNGSLDFDQLYFDGVVVNVTQ